MKQSGLASVGGFKYLPAMRREVTMREKDQQVLDALVRAREEHKELAGLLDFYRDMAVVQFEAKAQIPPYADTFDEATMRQCMADGLPQLTFDQLTIEPERFAHTVKDIVGVLAQHSSDWAVIAEAMEEPRAEELMKVAKEAFERKSPLAQEELSASGLTVFAVESALVPYLERAAEALMPRLDQSLWLRGYCPLCGAAPDFAFLDEESGARHLVCSRCNSQWRYVRLRCPFCGTTDQAKLQYYPSDDKVYRLYVCELCKHYLKAIDLREARKETFPAVERVATAAMDVAAQEKGYVP